MEAQARRDLLEEDCRKTWIVRRKPVIRKVQNTQRGRKEPFTNA